MARPRKELTYLKKNKKYMDFDPVIKMEGKYDIALIQTRKGTGKTFGSIREGHIRFRQTGKPFAYTRATFEQLKEFAAPDKYASLLSALGYYMAKNEKISTKGHYKLMNKTKKNTARTLVPINYFLSINQAMNIQSSKFEPLSLMILDEIQHHFREQKIDHVNKAINLIASVLRDHNCPIWIISNKIDQEDIFLRKFKLEREMDRLHPGEVKRFTRSYRTGNKEKIKITSTDKNGNEFNKWVLRDEVIEIKFLIYKPAESNEFKDSTKKSIAYKLSALTDYGSVINSDDYFKKLKRLPYIKKLGNFKGKININGLEFGLWTYKTRSGTEIYQFTNKVNQTGKTRYFSYIDYDLGSLIGSFDFVKKLKHKLIKGELQFSDIDIFTAIIELINLKGNGK